MARIIAIANQKGGVGKTTTAVNLSASLAQRGHKVLLIDSDPQGNATSGVGVDKSSLNSSLYDVYSGEASLEEVLVSSEIPTLWVAPSTADLVGSEIELTAKEAPQYILKKQLSAVSNQFNYVFIDCPPSLGLLTVNALVASDSLLVPLQCEYYALEGISALMKTIELAQGELNPNLALEGVVLTMFDSRTNLSRQIESETRKFFSGSVFETVIPRNVKLSECPSFGQPIIFYDPSSVGAGAYDALGRELDKKHFPYMLRGKAAALRPSKKTKRQRAA